MMISKSQYIKYLQCPKYFWLSREKREMIAPPDVQQKKIFETGIRVGEIARDLFRGGKAVQLDLENIFDSIRTTEKLISENVQTLYEGVFLHNELYGALDILQFENGKWHIYEVKSSTGVKEVYLDDAAFQSYLLEQAGMDVGTVNIVHINKEYVRHGNLDLQQVFTLVDVTTETAIRKPRIFQQINTMKLLLDNAEPVHPIGPHCQSPYECGAKDYCWRQLAGIPDNSVFDLTRATIKKKFNLFQNGIVNIADVPVSGLTDAQRIQVAGKVHIEPEPIRLFVQTLNNPVSHLDFETYQQAIPEYEGLKAFQQIPFQFSLHIEKGCSIEHKEFLALSGKDPRRELAEALLGDVPADGSILAYNSTFEKRIIFELADVFTDLRMELLAIVGRIEDLMIPFQKHWYYHPDMNGSYSIKKVLPAVIPGMSHAYKNLPGVKNGSEASAVWSEIESISDQDEQDKIRKGLLEYCKLDTLAMVKILDFLRTI